MRSILSTSSQLYSIFNNCLEIAHTRIVALLGVLGLHLVGHLVRRLTRRLVRQLLTPLDWGKERNAFSATLDERRKNGMCLTSSFGLWGRK